MKPEERIERIKFLREKHLFSIFEAKKTVRGEELLEDCELIECSNTKLVLKKIISDLYPKAPDQ